ncbi:MAG: SpoIIIAH-like family protein [Clostridia bacterium]|nr:SpoIIIAH-like family protein [Clostridia bacterium]
MGKMMVLKRKEIVAAALVVMIGVAGYLNWSYQDVLKVSDGGEYTETSKKLGEAELVSSKNATEASHFDEARKNKETSREKALDILNETAQNESFDEETRQTAQKEILNIAKNVEHETQIESAIKAKGFQDACVYIDSGNVEIAVKKDGFTDQDAVLVSEIATSRLSIPHSSVKIIPVK